MYHITSNQQLARYGIRHHPGMSGLLEDVINTVTSGGKDIKKGAEDTVKDKTSDFAVQLVATPEFKDALAKVLVAQTKKNAFLLISLAVAGGTVGGTLFKGKVGMIAAGLITMTSGWILMNGGELLPPKKAK